MHSKAGTAADESKAVAYIGNRLVPVEDAVANDDDFLKGAKKKNVAKDPIAMNTIDPFDPPAHWRRRRRRGGGGGGVRFRHPSPTITDPAGAGLVGRTVTGAAPQVQTII